MEKKTNISRRVINSIALTILYFCLALLFFTDVVLKEDHETIWQAIADTIISPTPRSLALVIAPILILLFLFVYNRKQTSRKETVKTDLDSAKSEVNL